MTSQCDFANFVVKFLLTIQGVYKMTRKLKTWEIMSKVN